MMERQISTISYNDESEHRLPKSEEMYEELEHRPPKPEEMYDVSMWVASQSNNFGKPQEKDYNKNWQKRLKEIGIAWGGSLIMQTVIGPGIFTSPKAVMDGAGSVALTLIIWGCCGIFTMLAALCFVELQMFVRRDGCEYGYIHKAFGPLPAFVYTWMRMSVAEPITTAVFAVAFGNYISDAIADACGPPKVLRMLLPVLVIISLALLNSYSVGIAKQIGSLANVGKFLTISTIIVCGIYRMIAGHTEILATGFEESKESHESVIFAVYNSLWAYGGWANVPNVTTNVRKPPKNLPRLVKIVMPSVMIIYLLCNLAYLTVITKDELIDDHSFGVVWGRKMLGKAGFVIPIGVALVALSNTNNTFLSSGRINTLAVQDGYVPELLSYINVNTKAHVPSITLRAVTSIVMSLVIDVNILVRFYVFTVWLFHGLSMIGLIVMRITKPQLTRPYKVNILIPVFVSLGSLYLVITPFVSLMPRTEFLFSIILAAVSIFMYFPFVRFNWSGKLVDRVTVFFQLLLEVSPQPVKHRRHRKKKLHGKRPATITPIVSLNPNRDSVRSADTYSVDFSVSEIFTVDDACSVYTIDSHESHSSSNDKTPNFNYDDNIPPTYEEAVTITRL